MSVIAQRAKSIGSVKESMTLLARVGSSCLVGVSSMAPFGAALTLLACGPVGRISPLADLC